MMSWYCLCDQIATMSVISCCYHKMKTFPVSNFLKQIISNEDLRSHFALRLACQERLCHWMNLSDNEHKNHWLTFSKRVILEKVCEKLNVRPKKTNRHGIRKSYLMSKDEYIYAVEQCYQFENCAQEDNVIRNSNSEPEVGHQEKIAAELKNENFDNFEWLEIVTGLQSYLQILLEYLVLLDKVTFLRENDKDGYLIQIFDETVSPRCIMLHSG